MPSSIVLNSSSTMTNLSNASMNAVPGMGLAGTQSILNGLMAWEDVELNVREHALLDQEVLHSITGAEQRFRLDPSPRNRARFRTVLQQAQQASEQLQQYCLRQQAHYQALLDQEVAGQSQPQGYFASWHHWMINGVKYFFGSDNAALVEKYQQAAFEQRQLQAALQTILDNVFTDPKQDVQTKANPPQEISPTQRRLLSTNNTLSVKKSIPTQIVRPGDTYDYTIEGNDIFDGNFTRIGVTRENGAPVPLWLEKQPILRGSYRGNYSAQESVHGIVVQESLAFVVYEGAGLQIIDVSNSSAPVLRGNYSIPTPGYARGVTVNRSLVFVAAGSSGLEIINVSNPSTPILVGNHPIGNARGVTVEGVLAFVAADSSGLQIVDVSNPSMPILIGNFSIEKAQSVAVQRSFAFVADYFSGLRIINVSNPSSPTWVGSSLWDAYATSIVVQGSLAFVVDDFAGIWIIDASNLSLPVPIGNYNTRTRALGIVLQGSLAFVAVDSSGLEIIDVSNPSAPEKIGSYTTAGKAQGAAVSVQESLVFVANGAFGLQIVDQRALRLSGTPLTPDVGKQTLRVIAQDQFSFTASVSIDFDLIVTQPPQRQDNTLSAQSVLPGETLSLLFDADQLFNNRDGGFLRLSVELAPTNQIPRWMNLSLNPVLQGNYDTPGLAWSVAVQGSLVFVADWNSGLQIIDVSNLAVPVLRGNYSTSGNARAVAVQLPLLFVAAGSAGLQIIDVSNLSKPVWRGSYPTPAPGAQDVAVRGSLAFVVDWNSGLQIIDVSNSSAPVWRGSYPTLVPGTYGVTVQGSLAFVVTLSSGLQIIDVSNPSAPMLRGNYSKVKSAQRVVVQGSMAFIVAASSGIQIINVSNPSMPGLIGSYSTLGYARAVAMQLPLVFVACDYAGLQIIDVRNPFVPELIGNYKASDSTLGVALQGSLVFLADRSSGLQVIDISQWVLKVAPTASNAANHVVRVTVTDEFGGNASDTFLLRVEGPPQFNGTIGQQYAKVGQAFSYFVPQRMVTDPNFDTLAFTAVVAGEKSLPTWLGFNGISASFAGTPQLQNTGKFTIMLSVTDNVPGTAVVSQDFPLVVDRPPVVKQAIPNQLRVINQSFDFRVPESTFFDPDGDILRYSAYFLDQNRTKLPVLPPWLKFDNTTQTFTGFPNLTKDDKFTIVVTAQDPPYTGLGYVESEFTLSIQTQPIRDPVFAPRTLTIIQDQNAEIGKPFNVPFDNVFFDPNGDNLTYSATYKTQYFFHSLCSGRMECWDDSKPGWLTLDPAKNLFVSKGKLGSFATAFYADRNIEVTLSADDGTCEPAKTTFNIRVRGASGLEQFVNVCLGIASAAGTAYTAYKSRGFFFNRYDRGRYQKVMNTVAPGEFFERQLAVPTHQIHEFSTQIPRRVPCCRFFVLPYRPLPGVNQLPSWLQHDRHRGCLYGTVPDDLEGNTLIIQVLGTDQVILEEFKIVVESSNSLRFEQDEVDVNESSAGIEMTDMRKATQGDEDDGTEVAVRAVSGTR